MWPMRKHSHGDYPESPPVPVDVVHRVATHPLHTHTHTPSLGNCRSIVIVAVSTAASVHRVATAHTPLTHPPFRRQLSFNFCCCKHNNLYCIVAVITIQINEKIDVVETVYILYVLISFMKCWGDFPRDSSVWCHTTMRVQLLWVGNE